MGETCSCGSKKVIKDLKTHEVICAKCGTVLDEAVDIGPTWETSESGEKTQSRPKNTFTDPTMNIGTSVSDKDVKRLPKKKRRIYEKYSQQGDWKGK